MVCVFKKSEVILTDANLALTQAHRRKRKLTLHSWRARETIIPNLFDRSRGLCFIKLLFHYHFR